MNDQLKDYRLMLALRSMAASAIRSSPKASPIWPISLASRAILVTGIPSYLLQAKS
jgi:hypothetical protein